jgi:hypothetical protein
MSKQLHTAVNAILAMNYFRNEHACSSGAHFGHEEAVAERVKQAGFVEVSKAAYPKLTKTLLKKWAETGDATHLSQVLATLQNGTYILQPAGSQGFPDILVKDFSGAYVALECKSGKDGQCPMWNDNVPKPNTIYILSSGAYNATTVFLGKDVITQETYALMAQQEAEIELIVKKYKLLLDHVDTFNRGWIQKSRKQHFQYGGNAKTDYFAHADRSMCENNVLAFAMAQ